MLQTGPITGLCPKIYRSIAHENTQMPPNLRWSHRYTGKTMNVSILGSQRGKSRRQEVPYSPMDMERFLLLHMLPPAWWDHWPDYRHCFVITGCLWSQHSQRCWDGTETGLGHMGRITFSIRLCSEQARRRWGAHTAAAFASFHRHTESQTHWRTHTHTACQGRPHSARSGFQAAGAESSSWQERTITRDTVLRPDRHAAFHGVTTLQPFFRRTGKRPGLPDFLKWQILDGL